VEGIASAAISVTGLTKRYGETVALAELSLTVPRGTVFALLGPNGAGKTSAMKLLLGLARPTSGRGSVLGAPLGDLGARRRIGYLPEFFRFPRWMTVGRVLAFHCALAQLPRPRWESRIRTVLDLVRVSDRREQRVGVLSKGLQQRLGLAVALVAEPELLVLDEPTAALDPAERHHFRELIGGLKIAGTTVLLSTHLLGEAERVCDHLAILSRGRAVAAGPLAEFLRSDAAAPAAQGRESLEARYLRLVGEE